MTWSFPVASAIALKGITWIEARVGARYRGWTVRGGDYVVELAREDQVSEEFTGKTLEDALRAAAKSIQGVARAA